MRCQIYSGFLTINLDLVVVQHCNLESFLIVQFNTRNFLFAKKQVLQHGLISQCRKRDPELQLQRFGKAVVTFEHCSTQTTGFLVWYHLPSNRRPCTFAPFSRKFSSSTSSLKGTRALFCLKAREESPSTCINRREHRRDVVYSHLFPLRAQFIYNLSTTYRIEAHRS